MVAFMDDIFTARFQNFPEDGDPLLTVEDPTGLRLMATDQFYGHEIDSNGQPVIKALISKLALSGYVPAPGRGFRFEGDITWALPVVRRKNERYRIHLGCGCYDWSTFPPIGATGSCLHHGARQLVMSYLDTMLKEIHTT